MCMLYKGVPNGLAYIHHKNPDDSQFSFEGVGMFTDGNLHMGPFMCIDGYD